MARSAVQYRNCPASGLLLSVVPSDSSDTLPVVVYSSALPPFPAKTQSQGRLETACREVFDSHGSRYACGGFID